MKKLYRGRRNIICTNFKIKRNITGRFRGVNFFLTWINQKQELSMATMYFPGSIQNKGLLWSTSHTLCIPTNSFVFAVSAEKTFKVSANQIQEFPKVAMFFWWNKTKWGIFAEDPKYIILVKFSSSCSSSFRGLIVMG
jgi:hypothetical protein